MPITKNITSNSALSHLSENQIIECYEMYRNNELKNAEIIELYDFGDISPSMLASQFPLLQTKNMCEICSTAILEIPTPKSARNREYICPTCSHHVIGNNNSRFCSCEHCKTERTEIARRVKNELDLKYQKKLETLKNNHPIPSERIMYSDLSLLDKIYLASLIPLCNHDLLPSKTVTRKNSILTPASALDHIIYNHLIEMQIIYPAIDNLPKDVVLNLNDDIIAERYEYNLNISLDEKELSMSEDIYLLIISEFEKIINGNLSVTKDDIEKLCVLVEKIENAEALVFLFHYCQEAGLSDIPRKTHDVIRKMLAQMSVSQLALHIQRSVKDAVYFYITGKSKGKQHATNTIPSKIESSINHYNKNGWSNRGWDRLYHIEKSNLSNVVYDKLLTRLNLGFYQSVCDIVKKIETHFNINIGQQAVTEPTGESQ